MFTYMVSESEVSFIVVLESVLKTSVSESSDSVPGWTWVDRFDMVLVVIRSLLILACCCGGRGENIIIGVKLASIVCWSRVWPAAFFILRSISANLPCEVDGRFRLSY